MIKTLGANEHVGAMEIAGTPSQLGREAAILVQVIYNTLKAPNPAAGEIFRRTFAAVYESGTLWESVPVQDDTPSRRSGPVIPTQ